MKKVTGILLVLLSLFTFSCSDDDDNNDGQSDDVFIRAKVNGVQKDFDDPESLTSLSTLIRGYAGLGDTYQDLSLWIPNDATEGSHPIVPNNGSQIDVYSASFNQTFDIEAEATTGTLVITDISVDYIEGTFSYIAEDADGDPYAVTDGAFRAYNTLPTD